MRAGDYKFGGMQKVEVVFYLRYNLGLSLQGVRKRILTAIKGTWPSTGIRTGHTSMLIKRVTLMYVCIRGGP
jgi:hypothetical protein